jgi:hypothetical protein
VSNQRADAYDSIDADTLDGRFDIHPNYFRRPPKTVFKYRTEESNFFDHTPPHSSNIVNPYETREWKPSQSPYTPVTPNESLMVKWNEPTLSADQEKRFLQQLAWSINKPVAYTEAGEQYVAALSGDRSEYFNFIKRDASPTVTQCRITVTTFPVLK